MSYCHIGYDRIPLQNVKMAAPGTKNTVAVSIITELIHLLIPIIHIFHHREKARNTITAAAVIHRQSEMTNMNWKYKELHHHPAMAPSDISVLVHRGHSTIELAEEYTVRAQYIPGS